MTVRRKTLLIIGVTLGALIKVLYTASSSILLSSFAKLEDQNTHQNVKRVVDALSDDLAKLNYTVRDWAEWDDTYKFIEDANVNYIKANLTDTTTVRLKVNLRLYIHASGRIVFSKGFDLNKEKATPIPSSLQAQIRPKSKLLGHTDAESNVTGLLLFPEGPMMISSRPILTSEGTSSIRGTLMMGRYLDSKEIKRLIERTHLSLKMYRLDDPQLPPDGQAMLAMLLRNQQEEKASLSLLPSPDGGNQVSISQLPSANSSLSTSILIRPLSTNRIAGYTLLRDIYGQPGLLLRVDIPRSVYHQGQVSLRYLIWSLLAVGLVFGIVTLLLLEKLVLARLARLSVGVKSIRASCDLSLRLKQSGTDELSSLADTINQLLETLESAQQELRDSQEKYRQEKELAEVTLQSIGDAVITTDAFGRIESLNPVAEKLLGYSLHEAQGLPVTEVFQTINENTRQLVENPVTVALRGNQLVASADPISLVTREGKELAIDHSVAPIHTSHGGIIGAVLVFRDVTQSRSIARQLSWEASHDALTGVFNRREFEQRLEEAIIKVKGSHLQHALCYLDLDRFKIVNDTCGHSAGDELLRQITTLLSHQVRKSDTLARLGGDEFGILLYNCPLEQALRIANNLRESILAFQFVWEDTKLSIGVSIGLTTIDSKSPSLSSVLTSADTACYAAKNQGRNSVQIYQSNSSS